MTTSGFRVVPAPRFLGRLCLSFQIGIHPCWKPNDSSLRAHAGSSFCSFFEMCKTLHSHSGTFILLMSSFSSFLSRVLRHLRIKLSSDFIFSCFSLFSAVVFFFSTCCFRSVASAPIALTCWPIGSALRTCRYNAHAKPALLNSK